MNYYDEALKLHEKYQGKIHTELNCDIQTMDDNGWNYGSETKRNIFKKFKYKVCIIGV